MTESKKLNVTEHSKCCAKGAAIWHGQPLYHTDAGTAFGRDGWYINIMRHHHLGVVWEQVFI